MRARKASDGTWDLSNGESLEGDGRRYISRQSGRSVGIEKYQLKTYVNEEKGANTETRQSQTIADLLQQNTCRSKSGRRNKTSTVVVDHNADDNVCDSDDRLTEQK